MGAQLEKDEIALYTWFQLENALKSYLDENLQTLPKWATRKGITNLDELHETYYARLIYEFGVVKSMGFLGYFLIVADMIAFCRREGIPYGPGRGSGSGALMGILLGITKVDPIQYDLLFERFLNPDRYSMPDYDCDISQAERYRVKEHLMHKYGASNVASIATFARMKIRAAIRDVVRSLNLGGSPGETFRLADKIAKTLDDCDAEITYSEAVQTIDDFRMYMEQYPLLAGHIRRCEGILRQMSMHAAGVLISSNPLDQELPLIRDKNKMVVAAQDGKTCEDQGYLKLDTLGLKNLDIIAACRKSIEKTNGVVPEMELEGVDISPVDTKYDIERRVLDLTSEPVRLASRAYQYLRGEYGAGNSTLGIFQCEQSVTQGLLRNALVNSIENIADIIAGIRPGPRNAGSTELYVQRKRGEVPVLYEYEQTHAYNPLEKKYNGKKLKKPLIHDLSCMAPVCDSSQGIPFFQEQLMRMSRFIANFTIAGSDVLRKGVGKKDAKLIATIGEAFMAGCQGLVTEPIIIQDIVVIDPTKTPKDNPNGLPKATAEYLWYKFILPYGSYGFNLSHSIAYSLISFECVWLKANFPAEFYAALLSHEADQEKTNTIIGEAKAAGIKFLPPDVNKSTSNFAILDSNTIVYSLTCMKGVGDKMVKKIVANRPYTSMIDYLGRSKSSSLTTEVLIKGGAFDNAFDHTHTRKDYYDFFKDCHLKLKRQIDRILREQLSKEFHYPVLKGEIRKAAQAAGTYEAPAEFHKRMFAEDVPYQERHASESLVVLKKFEYDWTGPITTPSKGIAFAVERASIEKVITVVDEDGKKREKIIRDERNAWTTEEQFDFEEEIFGTVLSGHRLDPYRHLEDNFLTNVEANGMTYHRLTTDLAAYEKDEEVYIFCQGLRMMRKAAYKKDPKKFTRFFEIEDRFGKDRITVFEQGYKYQLKKSPMNPLSIMAKKIPFRPVMVIKCKVNEYMGGKSLVLESVIDWLNETEVKEAFREARRKELDK